MESEFTIEQAEIFAKAARAAGEIIQAAITAFERLAEALRASLAPIATSRRAFVRRIVREIVRFTPSHTRHAMRARKIQRYCQAITA